MITELTDNVAAYRLDGSVTSAECDEVAAELAARCDRSGSVRLLLEVGEEVDIDAETLWTQLRTERDDIRLDRIAVVGSERWHRTLAGLAAVVADLDVHHYPVDEAAAAWSWIRDGSTPRAEMAA